MNSKLEYKLLNGKKITSVASQQWSLCWYETITNQKQRKKKGPNYCEMITRTPVLSKTDFYSASCSVAFVYIIKPNK